MQFNLPYPLSTNRYYRKFNNIIVLSKEGKAFKNSVALNAKNILACDVGLVIVIHPCMKKDGTAFARVIDLDNSLKCILDSLIGIAYVDDKQVKRLTVSYGHAIKHGGATVEVIAINNSVAVA